jgi:hypothetical protein
VSPVASDGVSTPSPLAARSRFLRLLGLIGALVVLGAAPAHADAAGPGNYESEVTGLAPAVEDVHAEIRGGDAFLQLDVDRGHEVVVEGYEGEPYLRFDPDGGVFVNHLSPARQLNGDRFGTADDAGYDRAQADPDAPPDWRRVADGGTYAWHDHRIHYMGGPTSVIDGADERVEVFDWAVPMSVDGQPVEVQGTLFWEPDTSVVVDVLPGLVLAVAAGFVAWRWPRTAGVAVLVAAVLAVVVERGEWVDQPSEVRTVGAGVVTAGVALAAAVAAVATTRWARAARFLGALAGAALVGWALTRLDVIGEPVLPTALPAALERIAVPVVLGVGLAVAGVLLVRTFQELERFDDDEDPDEAGTELVDAVSADDRRGP